LGSNQDFNMEERFYKVSHGWASKYLWLHWKEKVDENSPEFIDEVKKGRGIFKIYSGTTGAEIIGGSPVLNYYSKSFIEFLEGDGIKLKKWTIKVILDEKAKKKVKQPLPQYYYLEPLYFVDFIVDGSYLKKDERERNQEILDDWIKKKNKIYFEGDGSMRGFYNLSSWDGSDLFGAKNTTVIIVTERLKKIIEKAKLKNIMFEELKKYEY